MASTNSEGFAQPWLEVSSQIPSNKPTIQNHKSNHTQFEKQIGIRPLLHGPIDTVDDQFAAIGGILISKLQFPAPDTSVSTVDKLISPNLKVRIYTPSNYAEKKPVCVFYHGGGWAMGDLEGEDAQLRTV